MTLSHPQISLEPSSGQRRRTRQSIEQAVADERSFSMHGVDLIVQDLPPAHDAIGEYTACLAVSLAIESSVRILTCREDRHEDFPGVIRVPCFDRSGRGRFDGLLQKLILSPAQNVVLQYNPFAWGRRGWAPDLVQVIRKFKRIRPDVNLGIMFHETYMMNPGFRSWVMRQYQARQLRQLIEQADVSFFSIEKWALEHKRVCSSRKTVHLPVGSNLPTSQSDPLQTRIALSLGSEDFVCGVFGAAHPSRMLSWIQAAVRQIATEMKLDRRVVLLHVGEQHLGWNLGDLPVVSTGRLRADNAADAIATMDIMLNPFVDGISTRRGSAMAALQQGVPLLTTRGPATDAIWNDFDGHSVFLADVGDGAAWKVAVSTATAASFACGAKMRSIAQQAYFKNFDWPVIATKLIAELRCVEAQVSP